MVSYRVGQGGGDVLACGYIHRSSEGGSGGGGEEGGKMICVKGMQMNM